MAWFSSTVVASAPPAPHAVLPVGLSRYWLPPPGADDPTPRNPPVATLEDMPVSVSTQLVPSVVQVTDGGDEVHVPGTHGGPPGYMASEFVSPRATFAAPTSSQPLY